MVVAKTLEAQTDLVGQLQARSVTREYEAVVVGVMTAGGKVDQPIARHGTNRQKMAVMVGGKQAVSHYRVISRFRAHTHVRVKLETGRTHQIRVHMSYIHFPLIGDQTYGGRMRIPAGASPELLEMLRGFPRQALHARRLQLTHPDDGRLMSWEVPLPEDMLNLLALLRQDGELGE
jgi:23S rRNA pseudouridine1911/1915/1917 synthase